MSKINDQNKLDEDEAKSSDHSEIHPGVSKGTVRDEECPDAAANQEQILEAPESVLEAGPGIPGAADADHDEGHQEEEEGHDETESIDGQVADGVFTFDADARRP